MTRLGIIGFGRMGYRTALAGRQAGLEVAAILDMRPDPWGLGQDPSLGEVRRGDLDAFLAAQPEVVAISTTADSHAGLFHSLADAGIRAVLIEKPVACSVADAEAIAARARAEGIGVLVNHNHRASDTLHRIRGFSGDPRFGRLVAVVITQGAGGLGNLGTHYFDLANWLFGTAPEAVFALGTEPEAPNPRGAGFHDPGGTVVVRYPGGRRLLLEIGDDVGVIGGYELRYERGRVLMPFVSEAPQVFVRKPEAQEMPKHIYGAPLEQLVWDSFAAADVVAGTAAVLADLVTRATEPRGACVDEAAAALAATVAARVSAESGEVVTLPLGEALSRRRLAFA